jgi:hypothetical protein
MKRVAIALALLLVFGAVRLPLEIGLQKEQRAAGFHSVPTLTLREQVSQNGFIAALSGFRSLVAAVMWIEAQTAWERLEWGRMAGLFRTVTTLQPKSTLYWDMSAWHMGYNASVAARDDKEKQPSEILRQRDERHYWELARTFYKDGIRNNPDSSQLWTNLGHLERQKFQDHAAAAQAYTTAATKPDSLPYLRRLGAYELAQVPGKEKEAYALLKSLYDESEKNHVPTLLTTLKQLEEKLGIPPSQRIKGNNVP